MRPTLALHPQTFSIHSLKGSEKIPPSVFEQETYFIGKTPEELSIVVPDSLKLTSIEEETEWRCFEILGPLDLSMTRILSQIATILAKENISVFAISTFDTDHFLIKKDRLALAIKALADHKYKITEYH